MKSPARKRNAGKTRDDILMVARRHFSEKGYEAIGVREIAAEAGVNAALINRYFRSKEGLFEEAVIKAISIDDLLEGDKKTFGARTALHMVTKDLSSAEFDPTLAFVNSIASPSVGPQLSQMIEKTIVPKLARWIGGQNARQRALLILSEILGFDLLRRTVDAQMLGKDHSEVLVRRLAKTLQSYVDDA